MTIRKKWILTLGLIAVITIVVNSFVLSFLTSHYFNNYLDENYDQTCNEIVNYLSKELSLGNYSESQISVELHAYLGDSITQIKVYDNSGSLIAEATDDTQSGTGHGMGMMRGMMSGMNSRYDIVDDFHITGNNENLGEVHITRYSTSGNSYAAIMFQNSLIRNSLISVGIVMILVFLLGLFMSKRVSKDLIQTADMAQNIEVGKENLIRYSTTKEIRIIQKSLESLESKLKLKQKARKTLVDEMVHQTRTPLTILKMHLEGMEDGVIQMKSEEFKVCENQIDNLSDIITNISSLIDAGTNESKVVLEEFELYQFMKQIVNGMRSQFQKKNIDFRLLTSERIQVKTDKYRLGQSIYNILTNAYKFTPSGGNVSLNFYRESDTIKIEIADTGYGIKEDEQVKIFDAYYKKSKDTGDAGDGIGLYIAKENMESLNGRIEVQSKEGKGSKFILVLPFDMNI
ncbi:MAG: HAMP domain-containing sensor histidine kinase [Lachnospiraceae bacterium]|jgi:signal transduction histidine kinase|nr:HAMP domain-containing sensor histidine kinase [Lachnospiraceae bacterium]